MDVSIIVVDTGDYVCCDLCSKDFTHSNDRGGFLFMSKGICPDCAPRLEANASKYGELEYIVDRARPGETFRDFVLRVR